MVLARALTFGGTVALAAASVSTWFSYDYAHACGWTCYAPADALDEGVTVSLPDVSPSNGFDGVGTWVAIAGVVLVLAAVAALVLTVRGRRVPRALGAVAGAMAGVVVVRVATQPDIDPARHTSNRLVHVEPAAYVGTAGALAAAIGIVLLARRASDLESPVA